MAKLIRKTAPYIRSGANVKEMMLHVLISLIPVTAFAIYSFKLDAVLVILTSVISMTLVEFIYYKVKKERFTLKNLSAVISGLIFGLTLPSQTPLYVVAIVGAFSIFTVKLMFGGLGNNVFNVAAVARAIVGVSFSAQLVYPGIDTVVGATALSGLQGGASLGSILEAYPMSNFFFGMGIPGAIGEVSTLAILIGAIYLIIVKAADIRVMLSYVLFFGLFSAVYAMFAGQNLFEFTAFSLMSGGVLFGAVFMATDPVTGPVLDSSKIYFGFGLAALNFLIRMFGSLPEGTTFAIVLMNMLVPALEHNSFAKNKLNMKNIIVLAVFTLIMFLLIFLGVK